MVSANMALYSTSPPSAAFSAARTVSPLVVLKGELDFGHHRPLGSKRAADSVGGGLSSLFAGGTSRICADPHPFERGDQGGSMALSLPSRLDSHLLGHGHDGRLAWAGPGSRTAEKQHAALSRRNSSPPPTGNLASKDGRGWRATGLAHPEAHSSSSRRASTPSTGVNGFALATKAPVTQHIGFRLGTDGDDVVASLPLSAAGDVGDVSTFSSQIPGAIEERKEDPGFQDVFRASVTQSRRRGQEDISIFKAHWDVQTAKAAAGAPALPSKETEDFRQQLLRNFKRADSLEHLDGRPLHVEPLPLSTAQGDQELLAMAQAQHAIFCEPIVRKAFGVAASAHQGQIRRDGSSYLTHCVETALLLAKAGSDKQVVSAGLLHDTLDDSMMSEQDLQRLFGDEVMKLVLGVSKLSTLSQLARDNRTAEKPQDMGRLRNMFLAMAEVDVVLIKLADRLHNLRTLGALSPSKQTRVAEESLELFAPLANRLGIWSWKAEIEDLCFKYLCADDHAELASKLEEGAGHGVVMDYITQLASVLREAGVEFEDLSGRPKNLYSVYLKMQKKGRKVDEIFDVHGLRLLVKDEANCYRAMDVVHSLWQSSGEEHYKDYIKSPKPNGYQSLHTVVQVAGHPVEIQIRTRSMHLQAEFGLAAHWRYKEGDRGTQSAALQRKVDWARWVLTFQAELLDTKLRLAPGGGEKKQLPPCPFPVHLQGCEYVEGGVKGGTDMLAQSTCDPVYVIVMENNMMEVQELPGGSTAGDMLRMRSRDGDSMPPLLNLAFLEDLEQELHMGDCIELAAESEWPEQDIEEYTDPLVPFLDVVGVPSKRQQTRRWKGEKRDRRMSRKSELWEYGMEAYGTGIEVPAALSN